LDFKKIVKRALGPELARKAAMLKSRATMLRTKNILRDFSGNNLKIIGFVKSFNEAKNGNLERCLKHLSEFCDDIVICDDSSRDNSVQIARKYTNNIIIMPNNFKKELQHKQKLLELTLSLNPDWIVWLDPDETFERAGELGGIRSLCEYGDKRGIDSFSFLYHNLWKARDHYRVDERWWTNWQPKLWKNTGNLKFESEEGLHLKQSPSGLINDKRTDIKIIHYGFSTSDFVKKKYETYKSLGQSGRYLDRIIDEKGIKLKKFEIDWFPITSLRITVVCLIFRSIEYLKFVMKSFNRHTNFAELLFIANDPSDEILEHMEKRKITHLRHINPNPEEYYINRVYRAWNYGGAKASGDILVFINSDMAFSTDWCKNLLKHLKKNRIITSRLVESGKLRSGKYGIEKDFGRSYKEFDEKMFEDYAERIKTNELRNGGLFMPCALYKDVFNKSGGYPKGNRVDNKGQVTSGDRVFFYETLASMGIKHYTAFDSIVYHIQEGEQDEE
jgi:hypothetical protein|tara:strand:+ start:11670 stop:13175 length:1506 start_codon:yes stop_codon:yes gene_type:complete